MAAAAPRPFSRTSATVLSVVFVAVCSMLRTLHLLQDVGYRDEQDFHHLPIQNDNNAPLRSSFLKNESFSACLFLMNDKVSSLSEWLAYHYHTLPLRRLIVAVHPNTTDISNMTTYVFQSWRTKMTIDEWRLDGDAISKDSRRTTKKTGSDRTQWHDEDTFYKACMTTLFDENRTWTAFLHSNEYLALEGNASMRKSGSILSAIHHDRRHDDSPCISRIPRVRSMERDEKGILDVSLIPQTVILGHSYHDVVRDYCSETKLKISHSPFVIYPNSAMRQQLVVANKYTNLTSTTNSKTNARMESWLEGFIEEHGMDTAMKLLNINQRSNVEKYETQKTQKTPNRKVKTPKRANMALHPPAVQAFHHDDENKVTEETNSFSACLLVMDDNHVLKEWLAYHYHTLPLRHLIVAVDPRSITSPSVILNKWRKHGMVIEEWSDQNYLSDKLLLLAQNMSQLNDTSIVELHLSRQREFYQKCMVSLQKQSRTWTMLIDSDEFLMINKRATDRFNVTNVPPLEQPGSIMTFLQQELVKNETEMPRETPCIMIPRLRFGNRESDPEQVNRGVPQGFNASAFTTLRHRKHAEPILSKINKSGKVIIDVSRLHPANMHVNKPHRPLFVYCPKSEMYTQIKDNLLVVHHYSGTLDQFTFRDDYRRDAKAKKSFGHYSNLTLDDDAIRPWLGGFVKDKGVEAATELLEGVGELRLFENTTEEEETGALSEDDVFSACLLVMDDNHVLIEWLAYHYHALPLRHLIVAVDPRSITSPSDILGRWRGHGMTIEEWTDKDFMSEQLYTVAQNMSELNKTDIIELHRARQREFYKECMKRHKKKGRKWTMLTDTDEFLLTNIMATKRFNVTDVPPIEEPGSIMKFLKQERAKNVTEMPKRTACIMIPRLRFGSRESEPEKVNFRVPAGFNASTFATLRHRKHAEKRLSMINKTGKVIVDVSRLHPGHMKVKNPHRPLWAYCPKSELYTQLKDNLLVIHHYAGTWEQYIFRDDYRAMKTKKEFDTYNSRNLDDDSIRPWLHGFVQDKGEEVASALLKDVGKVPPKNTSAIS